MGYIAVNDLIQNMTPEQKILAQQFYSRFDIGSGVANKKIINVEPFFYMGTIVGSELTTYAATKLYLCLSAEFSYAGVNVTSISKVELYNEGNVLFNAARNIAPYWDATAAAVTYLLNNLKIENCYFGRIVGNNYAYVNFSGYRMTLGTV